MTGQPLRFALTRRPGPDLGRGLTTADLGTPDYQLALEQHSHYVEALEKAGLSVRILPPLGGYPDAWFIEDVAVVAPGIAVLALPGAASRQGEARRSAELLKGIRHGRIEPPGTLDGGDVLIAGGQVFVGLSERTNPVGARQLAALLEPQGYACCTIEVGEGLHLKSEVNGIDEGTLLVTPRFSDHPAFGNFRRIVVDPDESYAANALRVNHRLFIARGFPKIRKKLAVLDVQLVELEMSEAQKMDGGLTCLSLRF